MKNKITKLIITVISLVSLIFISQQVTEKTTQAATNNSDPVFFIPGSYSNIDSWDKMYERLDSYQVHPIVKIYVDEYGNVSRTNVRTPNTGERPFVTIFCQNILWNDDAVYQNSAGLINGIDAYRRQSPFNSADIVGQSMGGVVATRYMEINSSVKFNNFITTGTPFNMRATNGQPPTDMLINLAAGGDRLNHNMNVINVIGRTLDDPSTDSVVSRDSAMAGRNIFIGNVGSFKNLYLSGNDALHPNQIESAQFAQILQDNLAL
ncbi:alpha/beta hydrolase [Companilactobacillus sp.]|uniref:alpha/beta hydrolase n=1 Tax=Companilactobacillus sp. TaxID=2767905 RepID=UPI00260DD93E|nr:alpha/beta hydrolase [Companilactobacillus sp.]